MRTSLPSIIATIATVRAVSSLLYSMSEFGEVLVPFKQLQATIKQAKAIKDEYAPFCMYLTKVCTPRSAGIEWTVSPLRKESFTHREIFDFVSSMRKLEGVFETYEIIKKQAKIFHWQLTDLLDSCQKLIETAGEPTMSIKRRFKDWQKQTMKKGAASHQEERETASHQEERETASRQEERETASHQEERETASHQEETSVSHQEDSVPASQQEDSVPARQKGAIKKRQDNSGDKQPDKITSIMFFEGVVKKVKSVISEIYNGRTNKKYLKYREISENLKETKEVDQALDVLVFSFITASIPPGGTLDQNGILGIFSNDEQLEAILNTLREYLGPEVLNDRGSAGNYNKNSDAGNDNKNSDAGSSSNAPTRRCPASEQLAILCRLLINPTVLEHKLMNLGTIFSFLTRDNTFTDTCKVFLRKVSNSALSIEYTPPVQRYGHVKHTKIKELKNRLGKEITNPMFVEFERKKDSLWCGIMAPLGVGLIVRLIELVIKPGPLTSPEKVDLKRELGVSLKTYLEFTKAVLNPGDSDAMRRVLWGRPRTTEDSPERLPRQMSVQMPVRPPIPPSLRPPYLSPLHSTILPLMPPPRPSYIDPLHYPPFPMLNPGLVMSEMIRQAERREQARRQAQRREQARRQAEERELARRQANPPVEMGVFMTARVTRWI